MRAHTLLSRPPYPQKFRDQIIELARNGRTPKSLAEEFEPTQTTIRNWLKQTDRDEGKSAEGLFSAVSLIAEKHPAAGR